MSHVCNEADYDLSGHCMPAMVAQCAVEPEVAMYVFSYWGHPMGRTALRRTTPSRRKTRTTVTRGEPEWLVWKEVEQVVHRGT